MKSTKWVHELILERIPPLSWFSPRVGVILEMIIMEVVCVSVALYLSLPASSFLAGSLAILAVSLWSFLLLQLRFSMTLLEPSPVSPVRGIIEDYQEALFSPRRPEVWLAASTFIPLFSYLVFLNRYPLTELLHGHTSLPMLILWGMLLWDISYRLSLGFWSALLGLRRSINLRTVLKTNEKIQLEDRVQLRLLRSADLTNFAFGWLVFLLYLFLGSDRLLFFALAAYSLAISLFSAISLLIIARSRRKSRTRMLCK